jgi:hypothetical protein
VGLLVGDNCARKCFHHEDAAAGREYLGQEAMEKMREPIKNPRAAV